MLTIATGKDTRFRGHLGLRIGNDKSVVVVDIATFNAAQIGALTGGKNDMIGFERQQAVGVVAGIELTGLVL